MFKRKDIKKLSIIFDCEEKDVRSALTFSTKSLKSSDVNPYSVARVFSIFADMLSKSSVKRPKINYPDFNMRSDAIKKYRRDIVDLYDDNVSDPSFGYGSIAKHLEEKYGVKVSRQTIKTYVEKFEEWKSSNV